MEIQELDQFSGDAPAERVVVAGRVRLVKMNGRWLAMNYVSAHPRHLRNDSERREWAAATGHTLKDVRNAVQREKRREAREQREQDVKDAKALLTKLGYVVTEG